MEIVWYGQTCFRLSARGLAAVVTDPYPPEVGLTIPRLRAHVVTAFPRTFTQSFISRSSVLGLPGSSSFTAQ